MVENDSGYKLGQRVRHAKFGEGTIVNIGSGEHSRLQVAFQGQGIKYWWRLTYDWRQCNLRFRCRMRCATHRIRHQHLT